MREVRQIISSNTSQADLKIYLGILCEVRGRRGALDSQTREQEILILGFLSSVYKEEFNVESGDKQ